MFGKNAIADVRPEEEGLLVKEMFYTIQGEGPWAGKPAIFLRLAGCNLRCWFCDTDFEGGAPYTVSKLAQELVAMSIKSACPNVVITGGEPLLQRALTALMEDAISIGHDHKIVIQFQIETAGTVTMPAMGYHGSTGRCLIVVSPKTPKINETIRKVAGAFKYIIKAGETMPEDGLPTLVARPSDRFPRSNIYVQPMDEGNAALNKLNGTAAAEAAMRFGYRLSIQMHKIVGVP